MNSRKVNKTKVAAPVKKTLDTQHMHFMACLQENKENIERKTKELEKVNDEIDHFVKIKQERPLSEEEVDMHIKKIDQRIDIEMSLRALNSKFDENSYLTNNSSILFKYYDLVENGSITNENVVEPINANSILNFFNRSKNKSLSEHKSDKLAPSDIDYNENSLSSDPNLAEKAKNTKSALLDAYLFNNDEDYRRKVPIEEDVRCCSCSSKNVSLMTNEGYIVCIDCDSIEYVIIDHEKPSYKDPPKEISYFCYKRGNHLNEWISQIQGKETTEIPDEVYDNILLEFKKQRITNMASLTSSKLRQVLKKLELNKYYEHIPHIIFRLNGLSNPNLEPEFEEKLRNMFKQIQGPFLKFSPEGRKNFLSYSYVLHKFFQLLEKDDYLPSVNLLKSRDKLMAQDVVWKKICKALNWHFIPSL